MKQETKTKVKNSGPSNGMETKLYNQSGKEIGKVSLPEEIFGLPWNADLVHQVVTSMQSNARGPVAHTKQRGEVRGGGRKPWQQKGTGRARHGSSRSPIWKGGGVTHGPRNEKIYEKKINQKMRQKALLTLLSRKQKEGEILFIDKLEMQEPKASAAKKFLAAFDGMQKKNAALIALPGTHTPTQKSFGNFSTVEVVDVRNLNPVSVLSKKVLVIADPSAAFEVISKKTQGSTLKTGLSKVEPLIP